MDLFSLTIQALKEAERLAADVSLTASDRLAAATLADALKSLRGPSFRFRDMTATTGTPN